jgi:RNA polymerase sigma-70 factor (ECF subfamily)
MLTPARLPDVDAMQPQPAVRRLADGTAEPLEDREEDDPDDLDPVPAIAAPHGIACSLGDTALAQLLGRIMRQDEAAMASLYDELRGRVYALALHITGTVGTAEEVLQDTFWQVWRQAPRFDAARGSAVAWIMTMARSRALDARRASRRDILQSHRRETQEDPEFEDASATDPLDLLDTVQRDTALHATLATLDPLRRQLIGLVFYRGLTHDEIAIHMGLPLGTVKSHLRRTLITLREALGPDFNVGRPEVQA